MDKTIDLSKTVYELANSVPDFLDIMETLGFGEMRNCVVSNPMTREITVPMAMGNHNFEVAKVISRFEENGYTVINA